MIPNTGKENVDREEDRLSNLPDDILTGILSHLELKELVRSGILSKRWKSVWLSVSTLVLCQYDFRLRGKETDVEDTGEARFSNFVNEMLFACKLSLEKIHIDCCDVDPHLVQLWMQAALGRDASKLEVEFNDTDAGEELHPPCELTNNLFSYNKLVVLKLGGYMAPNFVKASSCFPSLKELELKDIYFRDYDSLPNMLSCCPVLECMTILREGDWDINFDNTGTLIITSRSLKRLIVRSRVDHFLAGNDEFKIVIDAPAVEFLYILCYVTKEYVVKNLSSLVKAELNLMYLNEVLEVLKSSPQLQILNLNDMHQPSQDLSVLPELDVPSCLITRLKTINIVFHSYVYVEKVRYFLINAKVLERMTIKCIYFGDNLKLELCNVLRESARGTVTWSDIETGVSEAVISFSENHI